MTSLRLKMIREQRIGVLILVGIILIIELFIHREFFFDSNIEKDTLPISIAEILNHSNSPAQSHINTHLQPFNPNDYTQEDWKKLGFSEKQAGVILKYKNMLGGIFTSKEQLKKCFVISEEKYAELSPFFLLPEKSADRQQMAFVSPYKKYQLQKFDPNIYSAENWKNIGFSEKQAEIILKYKNIVGGKFTSKEQLKKCFVISEEKYAELSPFIQLPEKSSSQETKQAQPVPTERKELNSASFKDIIAVTENAEITGKLLGFRKGLGGFVSKEQIRNVYGITPEQANLILETFDLDITKVHKISLETATEEELQNQIYLRKYKSKIMEAQKAGISPLNIIPKSDPNYNLLLMYLK